MSASMNADSDIELFREDLVALKRDVASLIEHMKGGATNTVQNAAGEIEPPRPEPTPASGSGRRPLGQGGQSLC